MRRVGRGGERDRGGLDSENGKRGDSVYCSCERGGGGVPLSLSNFIDSDNIELRQPLSLRKMFDSDKCCLNPLLEKIFRRYQYQTFLLNSRVEKTHRFMSTEFRQYCCIYSTSESYFLRGHLKVRWFFLQCT
jgi:hypothetical protein